MAESKITDTQNEQLYAKEQILLNQAAIIEALLNLLQPAANEAVEEHKRQVTAKLLASALGATAAVVRNLHDYRLRNR